MTQNSHLLPSDFGLTNFQELIYKPPNRAGDHLDNLDAFRDALLTDLAPMRPHEAIMAENIIMIEWDIAQILVQKRHIARSAVFNEITDQYVKLAEQVFSRKNAGRVWRTRSKIMISLRTSRLTEVTTSFMHMTLKLRRDR